MERFLVTLSLGPVQSLIGAARRTRDLWCGSWLLSESARAAARVLHEQQPGCLIFPCPDNPDSDLTPQARPGDTANIANILRAEITVADSAAARALCESAKAAAVSRLTALGDSALKEMTRLVRNDVWQAQIDDILEGFAAWVSITHNDGEYAQASKKLGGVLAARKSTRDFLPCKSLSVKGLPKSSLDGALETVLPDWPAEDRARRKLRLSGGEQLDALGVIKRMAGESDQFTAYSRIAADPWIEQLSPEQQERLRTAYEPLVSLDLATRTSGNEGIYAALPFDAQMLYAFRLDNALSQALLPEERRALLDLQRRIASISREKTSTGKSVGEPVPYATILKADGDRMGKLLSRAENADQSRKISRALHGFASKVRGIAREHRGHAIYSGGDDVLALVPLARALDCACALARAFSESLNPIAYQMDMPADERPTLSVGLGIGHLMEPLGALRARADRAEQAAKGDMTENPRNALAITLGIRSGAELCWRAQWSDTSALDAFSQMTDAFREDLLPTRVAYDLRSIDLRLAWMRDDPSPSARGIRGAEVGRMLNRARRPGGNHAVPDDLQDLIRQFAESLSLQALAEMLTVARWLSARAAGDLGERT